MKKEILLAGFCIISLLLVYPVFAEKLSLQIERLHDDNINFRITIYDNGNNKINGEASYIIKDYSERVVGRGSSNSGEDLSFKLPKNPIQGVWKMSANYEEDSVTELFNVGDVKRADIRLEGDSLIIENTGNVAYDNTLLITIGSDFQTEKVYLAIGEVRKFRLTAPAGDYTVKVDDGSVGKNLVFNGVSLTGNVVGLESVTEGNFLQRYPLVMVFLVVVFIGFFVLSFVMRRKGSLKLKGKGRRR